MPRKYKTYEKWLDDIQARYVVLEKDGEVLEFDSAAEAAEALGLNKGHLSSVLNGKRETVNGYTARYKYGRNIEIEIPERVIKRTSSNDTYDMFRYFEDKEKYGYTWKWEDVKEQYRNKKPPEDNQSLTYPAETQRAPIDLPERKIVNASKNEVKKLIDEQLDELARLDVAANREIAAKIRECRKICEGELKRLYELENLQGLTVDQLLRKQRYLELRNQIDAELKKLGEELVDTIGSKLVDAANIVNPHFSVEQLKAFTQIDYGSIQFSERIWRNMAELREQVYEKIEHSVVLGYSYKDAARDLAERFNVSENRARVLTRTETARAYNKAAEQNYRDNGITEVEIYVERGACPVCESYRGKVFTVKDKPDLPAH